MPMPGRWTFDSAEDQQGRVTGVGGPVDREASPSAITVLTVLNRTLLATGKATGASMPRLMMAIRPVLTPITVW
jgi:hypothetical protein